jgi:hypothetical protein
MDAPGGPDDSKAGGSDMKGRVPNRKRDLESDDNDSGDDVSQFGMSKTKCLFIPLVRVWLERNFCFLNIS